jgi:hypothetical protein
MGDRRQGERREKEKGVIQIKKKDFFIWLFVICVMIISIGFNIDLVIINKSYRNKIEIYEEYMTSIDEEYLDDEYNEDEDYADEDYADDEDDELSYEDEETSDNATNEEE